MGAAKMAFFLTTCSSFNVEKKDSRDSKSLGKETSHKHEEEVSISVTLLFSVLFIKEILIAKIKFRTRFRRSLLHVVSHKGLLFLFSFIFNLF